MNEVDFGKGGMMIAILSLHRPVSPGFTWEH